MIDEDLEDDRETSPEKAFPLMESLFQEVRIHAINLGMDPVEDSAFMWIAEESFFAGVPPPWEMHEDDGGNAFYYHPLTDRSTWEHPLDEYYRLMFMKLKLANSTDADPTPNVGRSFSASLAGRIQQGAERTLLDLANSRRRPSLHPISQHSGVAGRRGEGVGARELAHGSIVPGPLRANVLPSPSTSFSVLASSPNDSAPSPLPRNPTKIVIHDPTANHHGGKATVVRVHYRTTTLPADVAPSLPATSSPAPVLASLPLCDTSSMSCTSASGSSAVDLTPPVSPDSAHSAPGADFVPSKPPLPPALGRSATGVPHIQVTGKDSDADAPKATAKLTVRSSLSRSMHASKTSLGLGTLARKLRSRSRSGSSRSAADESDGGGSDGALPVYHHAAGGLPTAPGALTATSPEDAASLYTAPFRCSESHQHDLAEPEATLTLVNGAKPEVSRVIQTVLTWNAPSTPPSLMFQWFRISEQHEPRIEPIPGARESWYRACADDLHSRLRVAVAYTNSCAAHVDTPAQVELVPAMASYIQRSLREQSAVFKVEPVSCCGEEWYVLATADKFKIRRGRTTIFKSHRRDPMQILLHPACSDRVSVVLGCESKTFELHVVPGSGLQDAHRERHLHVASPSQQLRDEQLAYARDLLAATLRYLSSPSTPLSSSTILI